MHPHAACPQAKCGLGGGGPTGGPVILTLAVYFSPSLTSQGSQWMAKGNGNCSDFSKGTGKTGVPIPFVDTFYRDTDLGSCRNSLVPLVCQNTRNRAIEHILSGLRFVNLPVRKSYFHLGRRWRRRTGCRCRCNLIYLGAGEGVGVSAA